MTLTPKLKLRPAIVAFMLVACTTYGGAARAASSSDTHVASAQTGSGNMQMQVFLQRRFRLPSASDSLRALTDATAVWKNLNHAGSFRVINLG